MTSGSTAISAIFIQPDPRRDRLTVLVEAPDADRLVLAIDGTDLRHKTESGKATIPFPGFTPWSPESPHLYNLTCATPDAPDKPIAHAPFGMREVSLQDQRVTLNQKPLALKGFRYSAAEGSPSPGESLRNQLEHLRDAGFNWIRMSATGATGTLLTAAGELGLLVSIELHDSTGPDSIDNAVKACRNHPSLIAWHATPRHADAVRRLDPTRLVFVAGGPNRGADAAPCVFRPFRQDPEPYDPATVAVVPPLSREAESFLDNLGQSDACTLASVRGLMPWTTGSPKNPAGLADVSAWATDVESAQGEAVKAVVDALRVNPKVAGFCFDDAAGRIAEGAPGTPPARLATFEDAFAAVRPVIRLARTNLVPRQEVDVTVALLNEARLEDRVDLSLQVVGPTNQVLWKKKRNVKLPRHGKELWTGTISASGSTGSHRFVVRLMGHTGRIAESSAPFFVTDPVPAWDGVADIIDPANLWLDTCRRFVKHIDAQAPVIVVPPIAPTVRAYPDNAVGQVLGRVKEGAVAIVFSPPRDWNDLMKVLNVPLEISPVFTPDAHGAIACGRLHPVLDGLPARGVLAQPYRGIITATALDGDSEEDVAWTAQWNAANAAAHLVLVRRYGNGRLVFTPLQLLERLGRDPVAERLFVNLLSHSERRAMVPSGIPPVEMPAVEWLRRERATLRHWRVIGPFPNWEGAGDNTAYPPEETADWKATYAGWFRALAWEPWFVPAKTLQHIDLATALAPETLAADVLPGTYYAYAEHPAEARRETALTLRHPGAAKLWVNDRLALENRAEPDTSTTEISAGVVLRQGRNSVLVKISVQQARPQFSLDLGLG